MANPADAQPKLAWFHCILSSYASWLDGDDRGFRTRHHREHIDGDYKNPPPVGKYAWRKERSERQLKQPPVVFPEQMRELLATAIRQRLEQLGSEVLVLAVSSQHIHLQTKLPVKAPKQWLGLAKQHAWFELAAQGWKSKAWGKGAKVIRIESRQQQQNTYRYILRHREQGAFVWSAIEERDRQTALADSEQSQGLQPLGFAPRAATVAGASCAQNQRAWDALARQHQPLTRPARDKDFANPLKTLDQVGWLGDSIAGKRLLCLAAGGGKHGALYAAAGAVVTVVDLSAEMLALDRQVAAERGYNMRILQASMDDLSMLSAGEFEIVIQPVSTCYVPDVLAVYREVARVTAPGGIYVSQHKSPVSLQAEVRPGPRGHYELAEPYYRTGPLPPVVGSLHREPGTLEFLHRWEDLLGGLCRAGFAIEDLLEPLHAKPDAEIGSFSHRSQFVAPYVRIKARRTGKAESARPTFQLLTRPDH